MSYNSQAAMSLDSDLTLRIAACAAAQEVRHPQEWASRHQWALAASPGWDEAYAYAMGANVERPGKAENVVTDGMILAAVQPMVAEQFDSP